MDTTLAPSLADDEWAVSCILSFTDPRTVCRLALLNKAFLAASHSDLVWTNFLPSSPSSAAAHDHTHSKRDLYFRLCRSIFLRGGSQRYWLDPATGSECHMLSANAMSIAWGTTPQYWNWLPCSGSWFPQVATLRQVCWFEVGCTFREVLRPGKYMVSFRVQLRSAFGWEGYPVKLSLHNLSKGEQVDSQRLFTGQFPRSDRPVFWEKNDDENDWIECDVGEFIVEEEDDAVEVKFSMRQTEGGGWKGGLSLDGAIVRASHVIPQAQARALAVLQSHTQEEDDEGEEDTQSSQHSQDDYATSEIDEGELDQELDSDEAQDSVEGDDDDDP